VTGTSDKYLEVRDWPLASGRNFSESELRAGAAVCLLGDTVRQELFGDEDPIGLSIRLRTLSCQVIGVLSVKGQSGFGQNQDDIVVVPLRTLQRRMAGNSDVNNIMVSARDGVSTEKVQADLEALLRERRKIRDGAEDDFIVRDLKEVTSAFTNSSRVLTALLGAVAAVSLIVGGVGIMNIMLVSVTERTREIGTRLAVGAMARDVLLQFLVEAVTLAAFGGIIGIALGLSAAALATSAFQVPFVFNPGIVILSFAFSAAVGIVFGFFPARRAAQLDPIEALRHE
jgi:putative ABC transport system permease protein